MPKTPQQPTFGGTTFGPLVDLCIVVANTFVRLHRR